LNADLFGVGAGQPNLVKAKFGSDHPKPGA